MLQKRFIQYLNVFCQTKIGISGVRCSYSGNLLSNPTGHPITMCALTERTTQETSSWNIGEDATLDMAALCSPRRNFGFHTLNSCSSCSCWRKPSTQYLISSCSLFHTHAQVVDAVSKMAGATAVYMCSKSHTPNFGWHSSRDTRLGARRHCTLSSHDVLPISQGYSSFSRACQSCETDFLGTRKNSGASILPPSSSNESHREQLVRRCRGPGGYASVNLHTKTAHSIPSTRFFSTLTHPDSAPLLSPVLHQRVCQHPFTKTVPIPEDEVTPTSIQTFLKDNGLKFSQGFTCFHSLCPRVKKRAGQQQVPNGDKLFINMRTGHFLCQHCGKVGGWRELQDNVSLLTSTRKRKDFECFQNVDTVHQLNMDSKAVTDCLSGSVPIPELSADEYERLMAEFGLSELKQSTLGVYNVRCDNMVPHLLLPAYTLDGQVITVKKLFLKAVDGKTVKHMKEVSYPRLGYQGVFGLAAVAGLTGPLSVQNGLVLTTSELDALAVFQETGIPALALTKGMTTLPQEVLPSLEQFDKLTLWFGGDVRAWEAAKQFAQKLGTKRCHVIRPSPEDPGPWAALQRGLRLASTLARARPVTHKSIVSFSQLRQEVFSELTHQEQVAGVKWRRYPALNRLLKGHRRGELTVFTGPTGSGKTTFMSDYSLDLAMQGVSTLWGSFEINNVRLGKMMLTQFSQTNLQKHLDQFDYWADRFEEIPMYFMTFHGQESIKRVIEAMSHAVYVHDIAHVVVDNLQFMMGTNGDWSDKFHKQDMIVAAFRKFSTTMNCHVTLVIHPRKEKDSEDLTTASVFGSAKATQEADNILILQDKRLMSLRGKKYIQVTKNRFDGELGVMLLKFDKETLSFSIKDKPQKHSKEAEGKESKEAEGKESKEAEGKVAMEVVPGEKAAA